MTDRSKTIILRESQCVTLQVALDDQLRGLELGLQLLVSRFGIDSDEVRAESARVEQLREAIQDFVFGPGWWRRS
jgi:hypothetical protein